MENQNKFKTLWNFEFRLTKSKEVVDKNKGDCGVTISLCKYIEKYRDKPKVLERMVNTSERFIKKGRALIVVGAILTIIASVTQIAVAFL